MKHALSFLLRIGIAGAALTYAVWGVDFSRLLESVGTFRPGYVLLYAVAGLGLAVAPGLRLRYLAAGRISGFVGIRACLMGLALNNVLPARLGEMGKALYLRREAGFSLGRALEAVFWERFFDLNALLALGVVVAALMDLGLVVYPLLGVVGGGWCFLAFVSASPEVAHGLLRFLPGEKLRLFAGEMLGLLLTNLRASFLGGLSLWTAACWLSYVLLYSLGLCLMAGLPADPTMVLTVFAVATLGFALPGAPGGMGVFEASMVLALGWFGVDKDRAFAVALTMHLLQYLPITAAGLWSLAASGMSLADLRRRAEADEEAAASR